MLNQNTNTSETITENIFRKFYGVTTFIEKTAIPNTFGFKSKKGTNYKGLPDFFKELDEYCIIVEAKADSFIAAQEETKFYMLKNKIKKDIIGIAVSGQNEEKMEIEYYYKLLGSNDIIQFGAKNSFMSLIEINKQFKKAVVGDTITDEDLTTILMSLNKKFNDNNVRDTERSLFFSALMIALNNSNFRSTYKLVQAPSVTDKVTTDCKLLNAHYLNKAILSAVTEELKDKINNLSKEFSWVDRFSFIKTIDIPLEEYIDIINDIETKIFLPFKNDEKQDILGRAYRIFLKRAGKVDNKNIILTPDHIKELMVKLARLTVDDVVLDTCTGSGGFLMEAMETMVKLANGNEEKIKEIKEKQLIGFEIDYVLFSLACSNMFLHGDGRTNMIYRSSLLTNSEEDKILKNYIKSLKPTKIIINPPYEGKNPINFVETAIEYLEPNGKLIVIMPNPTLTKNVSTGLTQKILEKAKLDFVIKMPVSIFKEQDRDVYTSIFGFTKTPHSQDDEVLFCNLKEDGLVSVQHKGRIDKFNVWPEKENMILNTIRNSKEVEGFSEKRKIYLNGNLIPYGVQNYSTSLTNLVKVSTLFDTSIKGSLQSESNNPNGDIDFITAGEVWKKHDTAQCDCEAIVYAVGSAGSLGRAHYVNGKFIASSLCVVMKEKDHKNYPLDLEFYSYYLMSIREKIISDLADGTSKLTINVDKQLNNYLIEYFPLDKQIEKKNEVKKKLEEFYALQLELQNKKNNLYSGLTLL